MQQDLSRSFTIRFSVNRSFLKVVSGVLVNITSGFIIGIFLSHDLLILMGNVLCGTVGLYAAIKIENILESYDS